MSKEKSNQILWENYAKVYDTLNKFYPYQQLIFKTSNEIHGLISKLKSKKINILEIGCGTGNVLKNIILNNQHKNNVLHLVGMDKSKEMLKIAKEKINKLSNASFKFDALTGDGNNIDTLKSSLLKNNYFEIIFLNLTLFNIHNKKYFLNFISKYLVKNGFLFIVDFIPSLNKKVLLQSHLKKEGIISLLKNLINTIKINKYTEQIFKNSNNSNIQYLTSEQLISLFKSIPLKIIKVDTVYEKQATLIIGQK